MKKCAALFTLLTVLSSSGFSQDTVQVVAGWNIIGSVMAGAVPDVLSTIPDSIIISSYWGYIPGLGYVSTDTLHNGTGYWVNANSNGLIVFKNTPPVDSCKSKAFVYEGKLYHTVLIGNQCWMAENLDVGTMVDSLINQTDNDTVEKYCYNNDPLNCALYGGWYQWSEAMQYEMSPGAQGICPIGWHLPSIEEFEILRDAVEWDGVSLQLVGQGAGVGPGTNTTGFSALPAGRKYDGDNHFYEIGLYSYMWSSTLRGGDGPYRQFINHQYGYILLYFYGDGSAGYSVRCIED